MAGPDSEFLTRASEAAFELGADGFRMSAMTITSRHIAFTYTGITPDPSLYTEGEPPPVPGREGRREYDWQPASDAPAWMNMAWLLEDLATWIQFLAEEHVTLHVPARNVRGRPPSRPSHPRARGAEPSRGPAHGSVKREPAALRDRA
ncbi:hypothetical protein [Streptomyces albidochromogenes]|uniref:Uncharacterized protein n=1 Tax=Streptomyces albidochromogenes TaxID=329524 RepID=A0ABW6FFB5_9ACTN